MILKNKINLLYDVSLLGYSTKNNLAKTGIFRVLESLFFRLKDNNELNIIPISFSKNYKDVLKYFNEKKLSIDILNVYSDQIIKLTDLKTILNIENKDLIFKILRKISSIFYNDIQNKIDNITKKIVSKQKYNSGIIHSVSSSIIPKEIHLKKFKRILTVYDLIPILYPKYFNNNKDHWLNDCIKSIKKNDYAIAISECTKNDLCNYRKDIKPDNVYVTHLAASNNFYQCKDNNLINNLKNKYNIPKNSRYILSLCTLEPRKNIVTTIKSFLEILNQEKIDDLYLVLAGEKGWDNDKIFNQIDYANYYKDKIIITGFVPDEDLAPLYSGALVFIYPSYYEGFGLPPLEAMQCGIPVITSNTSSLPEVVGDAGIMVNSDDKESIANFILKFYKDDIFRNDYVKKSLDRAKLFSWDKCADNTIEIYKKILER